MGYDAPWAQADCPQLRPLCKILHAASTAFILPSYYTEQLSSLRLRRAVVSPPQAAIQDFWRLFSVTTRDHFITQIQLWADVEIEMGIQLIVKKILTLSGGFTQAQLEGYEKFAAPNYSMIFFLY